MKTSTHLRPQGTLPGQASGYLLSTLLSLDRWQSHMGHSDSQNCKIRDPWQGPSPPWASVSPPARGWMKSFQRYCSFHKMLRKNGLTGAFTPSGRGQTARVPGLTLPGAQQPPSWPLGEAARRPVWSGTRRQQETQAGGQGESGNSPGGFQSHTETAFEIQGPIFEFLRSDAWPLTCFLNHNQQRHPDSCCPHRGQGV